MASQISLITDLLRRSTGYKDLTKRYTTIKNGATVHKFIGANPVDSKKVVIKVYDYGFEAFGSRYFVEANLYRDTYKKVEGIRARTLSEALNSVFWDGL